MPPRVLIFDFDGTLAELNIDFAAMRAEVEVLARGLGLAGPWPGQGYLLEQVEQVAGRLGDGFAQRAGQLIMERELAAARQGRLFAFTRPLLTQARARGYSLAIISRNCGAAIRLVFPQVDHACDVFLPREAVPQTKPHPGHPLEALKRLGLPPHEAALIGDHPIDMATALAAGCLPVGVASGRMGAENLRSAGAALVLPDASGLLQALAGA
ncbi:MAG: HAD family hydrolase [Desulfarculus sp.]|nr:HAD family hydrolase [Desulfarculus sp.]